jgi:micrococcal nuclease
VALFQYEDVTVLRWVDGDTVDLRVSSVHDFGFRFRYGFTFEDRFRLFGVNTPERGQPGWAEATAACVAFAPVGSTVYVETHKDSRDKYGRWLADIYVNGSSLNLHLIAEGLAALYLPNGAKSPAPVS